MSSLDFHIEKEELQKALTDVSRIVQAKIHLPILPGVKIVVKDGELSLIGNNAEIAIERRVSGDSLKVIQSGSSVIPAKNLLEIIKKLPSTLHVKCSQNQLSIHSEDVIVRLPIVSPADYPEMPNVHQENLTVPSVELQEVIKQTVFAVAKDFSKPSLTGVQFIIREGAMTCVATNSQRLAMRKLPIETNHDVSFTVPGTCLHEYLKLHRDQLDDLHMMWNSTHIAFHTPTFTLYSRLIEGVFPDISRLVPNTFKTTLTLNKSRFLSGIDRAALFSSEWRNHNVLLEVTEESRIKITSHGTETGRIEETQEINEKDGEANFRVTLDAKFLLDALKAIDEDSVKISYSGEMKPILIEPVGNLNHLHLVSPVRKI
ncbi:DNA polymerase III subunit beta [Chungangia koreensis]|uniref:Beta sliding clamp n=1 Tax=Chungangia koreensis TaxID=752657 RepID=A0ABV8X441_9LACT